MLEISLKYILETYFTQKSKKLIFYNANKAYSSFWISK